MMCSDHHHGQFEERTVLSVALAFQVIDTDEAESGGVDAVAQAAGLLEPVVEHVARLPGHDVAVHHVSLLHS
jgi:hypothetical protein